MTDMAFNFLLSGPEAIHGNMIQLPAVPSRGDRLHGYSTTYRVESVIFTVNNELVTLCLEEVD